MKRRIIFYLRGYNRGIVLTDSDGESESAIVASVTKSMSSAKISEFQTDNDKIIVRPSDIIAVQIAHGDNKHEDIEQEEISFNTDNTDIEEDANQKPQLTGDVDLGEFIQDDNTSLEGIESLEDLPPVDPVPAPELNVPVEVEIPADLIAKGRKLNEAK